MKQIYYYVIICIIFNLLFISEANCINIIQNNEINVRKKITSILNECCDSLLKYELPGNNSFDESWKDYTSSKYPFFCESDFNGDKISDFALILVSKNRKELFVCVLLSTNKSYKILWLQKFDMNDSHIPVVLDIEKKGIWESANGGKSVKNDGFIVNWLPESKSYIYYWSQNKFKRFFTD